MVTMTAVAPELAAVLTDAALLHAPLAIAAVESAPWTTQALLLRIGLPALLVVVGIGVWAWGRREQLEARAEIGVRAGFGGPPGTTDIGVASGFDTEEHAPDSGAGRARILGGVLAVVVGVLTLLGVLIYRLTA